MGRPLLFLPVRRQQVCADSPVEHPSGRDIVPTHATSRLATRPLGNYPWPSPSQIAYCTPTKTSSLALCKPSRNGVNCTKAIEAARIAHP